MNKKTNKIGFALHKITTDQFAIIESENEKNQQINLGIQLKFGLNEGNKILAVIALFKFEQNGHPFIIIEVACHFKIMDDSWNSFIEEGNERIKFPKNFVTHLAVITVGTTRGVLHSKTESTRFNEFLLPTINIEELVSEDIVLDLIELQ